MGYEEQQKIQAAKGFGQVMGGGFMLLTLVSLGMFGCPRYNVYHQRSEGEAELARAQSNRMIKVQEAEATVESAQKLADAEVIRAGGIAKANAIIGDSLKNKDEYLKYLWIETLKDKENEVIYVPTEAGIPIMEAGREVRK